MADMIVLKCDNGASDAVVVCPCCGWIGKLALKKGYVSGISNELRAAHTCPVCAAVYHVCSAVSAPIWASEYRLYCENPSFYGHYVRIRYLNRSRRSA